MLTEFPRRLTRSFAKVMFIGEQKAKLWPLMTPACCSLSRPPRRAWWALPAWPPRPPAWAREYRSLPVRSVLNRCDAPRLPFRWTINPYRGCEFGCYYCYARYTHEFLELREGRDFERQIFAKQNAAWLLRRDLRQVQPDEEIAIGTAHGSLPARRAPLRRDAHILEIDADGSSLSWYVDPATGHVLRASYQSMGMAGPEEIVQDFSEWKTVDGLTMPFRSTMQINGQEGGWTQAGEVQLNPEVDPKLFEKPAAAAGGPPPN